MKTKDKPAPAPVEKTPKRQATDAAFFVGIVAAVVLALAPQLADLVGPYAAGAILAAVGAVAAFVRRNGIAKREE